MYLKEIKKLNFDVVWKIENIELPILNHQGINIFFGGDELNDGDVHLPLPPTRKQIETMLYITRLPTDFIRRQSKIIRQYCADLVEHKKIVSHIGTAKIDLFNIEKHCHLKEIIIPFLKNSRSNNFILNCYVDWQENQGLNLVCRDNKIIKLVETDLF